MYEKDSATQPDSTHLHAADVRALDLFFASSTLTSGSFAALSGTRLLSTSFESPTKEHKNECDCISKAFYIHSK